ncbi:MAG: rRNA maturation RNase YbeY [Bacteroidales bacterium]|jgi:rRNA maturation RNase YbeY|nr:rRNA maturation RNase YbeY [Bacteroidales bacterium]
MIRYFTEDTTFSLKGKRLINKWLREVAAGRGYELGELNYIFCSDAYLLAINRQFLGHDYETDIITFDNSEDYLLETGRRGVSADIYISIDTVRLNGKAYGEGFERELHRVIVHGLLHLIGYDDTTVWKQQRMRAAENRALVLLDTMRKGE